MRQQTNIKTDASQVREISEEEMTKQALKNVYNVMGHRLLRQDSPLLCRHTSQQRSRSFSAAISGAVFYRFIIDNNH